MSASSISFSGLVVLGLLIPACANSQDKWAESEDTPPQNAAVLPADHMETLFQGATSGYQERARIVIRSAAEWTTAWATLNARDLQAPPTPEVDFDRQIVVVAATGTRSTGGYAIAMDGARSAGSSLYVDVVEMSPGEGCLVTQALTTPAVAAAIEHPAGDVIFVDRFETRDCE